MLTVYSIRYTGILFYVQRNYATCLYTSSRHGFAINREKNFFETLQTCVWRIIKYCAHDWGELVVAGLKYYNSRWYSQTFSTAAVTTIVDKNTTRTAPREKKYENKKRVIAADNAYRKRNFTTVTRTSKSRKHSYLSSIHTSCNVHNNITYILV